MQPRAGSVAVVLEGGHAENVVGQALRGELSSALGQLYLNLSMSEQIRVVLGV